MDNTKASSLLELNMRKPIETDITISYSQFSMFCHCPYRWKLNYVDKLKVSTPSIYTLFGTSLHETIQHWLTIIYSKTIKESKQLDLFIYLKERLTENYKEQYIANNNNHFTTKEQLLEFWSDGCKILTFLQKKRTKWFSTKGCNLMGIETPILYQASEKNPNVKMLGYLDVILYDTTLYRPYILDIKTSTKGWYSEKKDRIKCNQLVLYKYYFSKQYDFDYNSIDVDFFITKRKILEDPDLAFTIPRISTFTPTSGPIILKNLIHDIDTFIEFAFNQDGSKKDNITYPAICGDKLENCKWCEFKNDYKKCPPLLRRHTNTIFELKQK